MIVLRNIIFLTLFFGVFQNFNHKIASAAELPSQSVGTFETAECWFESPVPFLPGPDFECGFVIVPEIHEDTEGPTIKIPVAIIRATGDNPRPDPIFFAQGGPGGDAFEVFSVLLTGSTLGVDRDIVIFNQRGTLYAQPTLICPETIAAKEEILMLSGKEADDLSIQALSECYDRLQAEGINLSAYNSLQNAADVDAIREALGYDQYNFYGVSYGTLLGLHLMRNYPEHLRSVILDGVVPPNLNFIIQVPESTDRVFSEIIKTCADHPECQEEYPNLEERVFALFEKLNAQPEILTITDSETGEHFSALLDGDTLVDLLFQAFYFPDSYAVFPKLVANLEEGDYAFIEGIWPLFEFDRSMSEGMYFSVICAEDADFSIEDGVVDGIRPYFAEGAADELQSYLDSCAVWQVDQLEASVDDPVISNIPTLLLSGQYDPITPPPFADLAAKGLERSFVYVQPTGSHGVAFDNDCLNNITAQFINSPEQRPDASCLDEIPLAKFVESDALTFPFLWEVNQLSETMLKQMGAATLFLLGILSAFLVLPLIWIIKLLRKKPEQEETSEPGARRLRWIGGIMILVFGILAIVFISATLYFIVDSIVSGMANISAISGAAAPYFIIPFILAGIAIGITVVAILAWRKESWSVWLKLYYSFIAICAIGYVVTLSLGGMLTVLL